MSNDKRQQSPEITETMVEAAAQRMVALVMARIIERPQIVQWQQWAGSARAILEAALETMTPSHVAALTPDWCMDAFWRANPGRNAVVPSLYLLDFAREVLRVHGVQSATATNWVEVEKAKADAYEDAARRVEKLSEDYHHEHGSYDESTNAWEIGHRHGDRIEAWDDAVEAIRKRKAEKCQVTHAATERRDDR
jgi:hypothetical protein